MRMRAPRPAAPLLAVGLVLSLASACGDDDDGGVVAPAETTLAPTTAGGEEATASTTTTAPAGTVVEIEVAGGEPVGGRARIDVALGDEVTLRVTGDVTDEVHVHGYDLYADVAPGAPGEVTFTADIPGQFEVELHDAGTLLAELTVS